MVVLYPCHIMLKKQKKLGLQIRIKVGVKTQKWDFWVGSVFFFILKNIFMCCPNVFLLFFEYHSNIKCSCRHSRMSLIKVVFLRGFVYCFFSSYFSHWCLLYYQSVITDPTWTTFQLYIRIIETLWMRSGVFIKKYSWSVIQCKIKAAYSFCC